MPRRLPLIALTFVWMTAASSAPGREPVSFVKDVAPVLRTECLRCHFGPAPKGELDLTSRANLLKGGASGPAVVVGKSGESRLVRLVHDKKMPPKKPLAAETADVFRRWVEEGAVWEGGDLKPVKVDATRAGKDWWSLQPVRRPAVPQTKMLGWQDNPVDAFVADALAHRNLQPNPETDRRTFIRRVSMDLTGLWPSPEEVEAFIRDSSPNAYSALVDRLLASPAYGERWGRHWLDVVRFAESHGYEVNTLRPTAWPYRDYVIRALNRDVPFARFVRDQLAGDTFEDSDELSSAATGFLVAGPHDLVGNQTVEGTRQQRSDDLFDMVATTSTAFLGLTSGCARCHDHKFDPIAQKDFYGLEAVFAGVAHEERAIGPINVERSRKDIADLRKRIEDIDRRMDEAEPLAAAEGGMKSRRPSVNTRRNVERLTPVTARFVRMTIAATSGGTQPCIDEIEVYSPDFSGGNLARDSRGAKATASSELPNYPIHKTAHLNEGLFGNGHSWIADEPGRGWAQIELAKVSEIGAIVWGRDREGKFADRLATDYRWEVSADGKTWRTVAGSWDRRATDAPAETANPLIAERAVLQAKLAAIDRPAMVYAGAFRPPAETRLLKRGDVMQPGERIAPAAIGGIGHLLAATVDSTDAERRRALADWIAEPNNPLPARVMVNRVWHHHFGQGLVRTPSDFGFNGDRPSHPDLLDWLAAEFIGNGGRIKPLHRLIVLSNAYRQSSRVDPAKQKIDSENRLVWRYPSRRVEAEAVRDNVLKTSGALNLAAGGPGYDIWTYSNYVTVFSPKQRLGPDEFRRMVYQFKPRTQQDGTFGAFDCPDATAVVPRRQTSTTALQALNLLNDEFIHDQADRFAARVSGAAGPEIEGQVRMAFRLAFQRLPTENEAAAAARLTREYGLPILGRMLLNANEFLTRE